MILLDFVDNHPFVSGVIGSFIASSFFIFTLLIIGRPIIKISPDISFSKDYSQDGNCYYFKIINNSLFPAHDINLELNALTPIPSDGKMNFSFKKLPLKVESMFTINDKLAKDNKYAVQFRCYENLKDILSDPHSFLRLEIHAKNGLTGISATFSHDFCDIYVVKDKPFNVGRKLNIDI
jgi:hypothetical protein